MSRIIEEPTWQATGHIDLAMDQYIVKAAQYIRMSDDQHQYSTAYQMATIAQYAAGHRMRLVKTYLDEGKSGLRLKGRPGLQELLRDVLGGSPGFRVILVYDVSRWGRFQDVDEPAHYEFVSRQAGVSITYCAEPFEDTSPEVGAVIKAVKRAAAAEYSRELSVRVSRALCVVASQGLWPSRPPYGLRRLLVSANGTPRQILEPGELKWIAGDKSMLVPGPAREVDTVRAIFTWFVEAGLSPGKIIVRLNTSNRPGPNGAAWCSETVRRMLRNELYVGTVVYAKTSKKLHGPVVRNAPSDWIRSEGAVEALIELDVFEAAQRRLKASFIGLSDGEILERLKGLYKREGRFSTVLMREASDLPRSASIRRRLGSLSQVRELLGAVPTGEYSSAHVTALMQRLERETFDAILTGMGDQARVHALSNNLITLVGTGVRLRIVAAQPSRRSSGEWLWNVAIPWTERGDWNLVVRGDVERDRALDYVLLERRGQRIGGVLLERDVSPALRPLRHKTLPGVLAALPLLCRRLPTSTPGRRTKYLPLRQYLEGLGEEVIELSPSEIVQVIGADLPSHAETAHWWANVENMRSRQPQAKAWMGAGYIAHFRRRRGTVIFYQMNEQQLARYEAGR